MLSFIGKMVMILITCATLGAGVGIAIKIVKLIAF